MLAKSMAITPMKDITRRKHTVAALRMRSFFRSNVGLIRFRKLYFLFAKTRQNKKRRDASSSETTNRSSVTVRSDPSSIFRCLCCLHSADPWTSDAYISCLIGVG